ncbi:uncharacterized protein BJ171DRAFT_308610 [Polychytrium aggregatum]|uniref:uncharacterized protein n=1 Tax=Polychytrium aggregatum TaxID=110093 RepID=UPI0022FE5C73|nr:uncharacterized protein BJ171DRAFT_308610 [Polychytrium aggregatum]KAI9206911.1 hypothetical protein BJ171DRAFT_308610 [Polychytrium aggregatum]
MSRLARSVSWSSQMAGRLPRPQLVAIQAPALSILPETRRPASRRQMSSQIPTSPATPLQPSALRPTIDSVVATFLRNSIPNRGIIVTRFSFDTYKLVKQLERQGFKRSQAVAIMRIINAILLESTMDIRSKLLSKTELENESYLYKADLQELRNELQLLRQNDTANLKTDSEAILRDIEALNQKFADKIASLKSEVAIDMNIHKSESREHGMDLNLRMQEINHKLVLRISDLKTNIETMKIDTTRMIVWYLLLTLSVLIGVDYLLALGTEKEKHKPATSGFSGINDLIDEGVRHIVIETASHKE